MFDDLSTKILQAQNECALSWISSDGSPAATVVSYLFADNCLWMTAISGCSRDIAISRDGRVAVVVSGKGSEQGDTRCVSMRGHCEVLRDKETRAWFFPRFAERVLDKSPVGAGIMASSMDNATNMILKFSPEKIISYDAQKMMHAANSM